MVRREKKTTKNCKRKNSKTWPANATSEQPKQGKELFWVVGHTRFRTTYSVTVSKTRRPTRTTQPERRSKSDKNIRRESESVLLSVVSSCCWRDHGTMNKRRMRMSNQSPLVDDQLYLLLLCVCLCLYIHATTGMSKTTTTTLTATTTTTTTTLSLWINVRRHS